MEKVTDFIIVYTLLLISVSSFCGAFYRALMYTGDVDIDATIILILIGILCGVLSVVGVKTSYDMMQENKKKD